MYVIYKLIHCSRQRNGCIAECGILFLKAQKYDELELSMGRNFLTKYDPQTIFSLA